MADYRPVDRVIRKIGESHVIWFSESNKWIEFKEPAWFIYNKYINREEEKIIAGELTKRYGLQQKEAQHFLSEIIAGKKEASCPPADIHRGLPQNQKNREAAEDDEYAGIEFTPFTTRHYRVNKKNISISYGSPLMEYYFHRPLAHLETVNGNEPGLNIGVYEHKSSRAQKYILRQITLTGTAVNPQTDSGPGQVREQFVTDDTGMLKHYLYKEIASFIYDIPGESWMSHIHASAVTNGREALLFCSSSGSGKSTLAALLQLPEHKLIAGKPESEKPEKLNLSGDNDSELFFVSDDFVPVDAINMKAHVFPAAITIKKGSYPVISGLYEPGTDSDSGFTGLKGRQVRYLQPRFHSRGPYKPQPVKKIVFISYDPGTEFTMEKVPPLRALALFHEEAWVSHNPEHAQSFIDWFVTISFYRLEYSDIKKAREAIMRLFKV